MKSALLAAIAVIVAGLAVLAYVLYPAPYAVKVDGAVISDSTFMSALRVVKANRIFYCEMQSQGQLASAKGAGSRSYSSSFVTLEMRTLILFRLLDQYTAKHHVVLTAAELRSARASMEASVASAGPGASASGGGASSQPPGSTGSSACPPASGKAVFDAFPRWYRSLQERAQGELTYFVSLRQLSAGSLPAERSYYRTHLSQFVTVCIDGVVFSSQPAAKAFRAKISPGATLASVAAANHQHLDSACIPGAQLPAFVTSLAVGGVSQPESNGPGGWVVIQPTSRKLEPFAHVAAQIKQQLTSASSIATAFFSRIARDARVTVNPLYGTWNGRWPQLVVAPAAPAPGVLPATQTTQRTGSAPSPAPAGGSTGPGAGGSTGPGAG